MARHNVTGGWVELRDPKLVPERLRRPVITRGVDAANAAKNLDDSIDPESDLGLLFGYNDLVAVALIEKWSFGDVVSEDALMDLPGVVVDEIRALTAPLLPDLMPNFEPDPESDSPTVPSGA